MHSIQRSLLLLTALATAYTAANGNLLGTDYKQLKYWFMRSKGIKQEDLIQEKLEVNTKIPDFSLPTFDELTRQLMMFDILQTPREDVFAPIAASVEQAESLKILQRDLEVFCGDGARPEVNLAALTDRTLSAAGSVVHRKMLANPLASSDFDAFSARQAFILALIENPSLLEKADALCVAMAANEERMLSNWQDADAVSNEVFEENYFKRGLFKGLNKSSVAMELLTRLGNLGTLTHLTADYIFFAGAKAGLNYGTQKYIARSADASLLTCITEAIQSNNAFIARMLNPVKYYRQASDIINLAQTGYDAEVAAGRMSQEIVNGAMKGCKIGLYGVVPGFVALYLAIKANSVKKILGQAALTRDGINFLQDKLIGLGSLVRFVQSLENLGADYPEVARGLQSWRHINHLLHSTKNDDFASLVALLQTNTFTGNASFFSLSGRVLAAYKLALQERDKFAGAIELMGELDACVSAAKLYLQYADRRVTFCPAWLTQDQRPHIRLQNFWNPFVDYQVVVPNDIELGGNLPEQHVILTGSNTGGKSTVGLKGTLISLYLSHTYGLVPAEQCELSVFSDFSSYIHVVDDVATGESAFQAEINRANSLIKAVKSLKKDQYAFIVIDELFKGTSPEKGAPGAVKVVQHLAGYENVIFIIATHYKELTKLEEEIPSIVNMKIEIFEDEAGNLVKPYKLEQGISSHNVADILMESGLDIDTINVA